MIYLKFSEVFDILLTSMRDAFLAVTVFVGVMVFLFSYLQYASAGKFVELIKSNPKMQPIFGALMGLTPGCGGAIIMMPMYTRGIVTYGTVIATLIATLGDAAFILIGAIALDAKFLFPVLLVHLISLLTGIIWGYAIDGLRITPSTPLGIFSKSEIIEAKSEITDKNENTFTEVVAVLGREKEGGIAYNIIHKGYLAWWLVTSIGLILAILLLYWYSIDPNYSPELSFDILTRDGLVTWVGLIGTLLSIILYLSSKNWIGDDTEETIGDKLNSFEETLIHAASETAFVTFWVLIAYLAFEFTLLFSGTTEGDLAKYGSGIFAVVVASTIGLIPGCGPQIITITAYTNNLISFPALVGNAISQDGDALFPLLVRHKMASLWATLHTLLPALIVGITLHLFGVNLP